MVVAKPVNARRNYGRFLWRGSARDRDLPSGCPREARRVWVGCGSVLAPMQANGIVKRIAVFFMCSLTPFVHCGASTPLRHLG